MRTSKSHLFLFRWDRHDTENESRVTVLVGKEEESPGRGRAVKEDHIGFKAIVTCVDGALLSEVWHVVPP